MKSIKINFCDFWPGFNPLNNYLYNTLVKHFKIELSDDPDFLFFSCYSNKHLNYKCIKIQFLAENLRPNYDIADYALSFDYSDDERHLRVPLYLFYFDEEYTVDRLLKHKTDNEIKNILNKKKKFCCFIVSNPNADFRIDFFHELSKYKKVDSGGKILNNINKTVKNKLDFISEYKFIIAFENSSYPGYTTEKVLEPKQVDTIPIYWGNYEINKEMNTKSFLNYHDVNSIEKLIENVIEADNDEEKYISYLKESIFENNKPNEYFNEERLANFFSKIFYSSFRKPISSTISFQLIKAKYLSNLLVNKIKNRL